MTMSMDRIRESVTSVWAKALLGLIIVSFVLTGVSSYMFSGADTAPAKVNGQTISRGEFEKAYEQQRQRMEQQLGDLFAQLAADSNYLAGFRKQVLDQLINEALLDQWVTTLGLRISDDAVRDAIRQMPAFQVNGQFSNEVYLSTLRRQNLSVAEFRELVRSSQALETLVGGISGSAWVSSDEVALMQQLQAQTRDLKSVTIDAAPFAAKAEISDEAITSYYNSNPQQFQAPAKVAAEYVVLRLQDLMAQVAEPDEAAVAAWYEQHKNDYSQPEERRVAHILLTGDDAEAKAKALADELAKGGDFAAVAARDSKDPGSASRGGELPWITSTSFDADFAAGAFAIAEVGKVSEPVKSKAGVHLIKLLEVRGGVSKPLAEVRSELVAALKRQQAQELYFDQQQKLVNASFETPDSLADAAAAAGLQVKTAAAFAAEAAPQELAHQAVLDKLFDEEFAVAAQASDLIEPSDELSLIVRPTEYQPPAVQPQDAVKAQIVSLLRNQQAEAAATALAEQLLAALTAGDEAKWQELLAANGLSAAETKAVARSGGDLDPALRQAAFELARPQAGKLSAKVVSLGGGKSAVVAVTAVTDVVPAAADASLQSQLAASVGRQALETAIAMLREQADISYPAPL